MIQDLHAHTYYSFCSKDKPETVIETAIAGGVQQLGICDHSYGVCCSRVEFCWNKGYNPNENYGNNLVKYYDHMNLLREKYAKKIKILCGIEVCTLNNGKDAYALPEKVDISFFDFCLLENLSDPRSITKGDLFGFAQRCGCPVGVAHTDLFAFIKRLGEDPYRYFRRMAEQNIFWEMNVSYDSIHNYREHAYMLEFFKNEEQQAIVKESGVRLSVGFDGHRVEDYRPERVADYCRRIGELGIKLAFEDETGAV